MIQAKHSICAFCSVFNHSDGHHAIHITIYNSVQQAGHFVIVWVSSIFFHNLLLHTLYLEIKLQTNMMKESILYTYLHWNRSPSKSTVVMETALTGILGSLLPPVQCSNPHFKFLNYSNVSKVWFIIVSSPIESPSRNSSYVNQPAMSVRDSILRPSSCEADALY